MCYSFGIYTFADYFLPRMKRMEVKQIFSSKETYLWLFITIACMLKAFYGSADYYAEFLNMNYKGSELLWAKWLYHFQFTFVVFGVGAMAYQKMVEKSPLSAIGIGFGDWKWGLKALLILLVLVTPVVYFNAQSEEHQVYYASQFPLAMIFESNRSVFTWFGMYFLHYLGWEIMFRGLVLFDLKKYNGIIVALFIQALITGLLHMGKPAGEAWGAVIGGFLMAFLTLRSKSIVYSLLFHFYLGITNAIFIYYA